MTFAHSQKGMSLLGWMVVLALVAFFASAAFKLVPHYMDYGSIVKGIEKVEREPGTVSNVAGFYEAVSKSMAINAVRDLNIRDILDIRQEAGEYYLHLKYERREPLIQNIDLVVNFDKEFRIRAQ